MRLICGLVHLDGAPVDEQTLMRMVQALSPSGVESGPRITVERRIGGQAALAVLNFSRNCPEEALASKTANDLPEGADGVWMAGDLRLDRPLELARTLGLRSGTSATTLALAALARWGDDLPDLLHGDFALAAWNPSQRRLFCARDIMGTRPLCYTHQPGRLFAFASLPRGLHASHVASKRLDLEALGRMHIGFHPIGASTGFQAISWLPPGHSLSATSDGIRLHRAWRPNPGQVGSWRGSPSDAAENLRSLLDESVACRLPGVGPVAAHLSGGLDSSAVVTIAARHLRKRGAKLHTFTQLATGNPGEIIQDEREYVEAVLAQEGDLYWSPVYLPPLQEYGTIDPDLPLGGAMDEPDDLICASASSVGAGLLLSGAGGDEGATYNGSGIYAGMLSEGKWWSVLTELRARARRQERPVARTVAGSFVGMLLPGLARGMRRGPLQKREQSVGGSRRSNALSFLNPTLAARVEAGLPPESVGGISADSRITMLTDSYLVERADRWSILGARHGVAFSYPLIDRRILDFTLSLPLERFVDGGFSRQPFRNSMAGVLPESIRWRTTKFSPFPDLPANISAAGGGLLRRLERLRDCSAAVEVVDCDRLAAAFAAAAAHAADSNLALGPIGQAPVSHWCKMALHATRALTLAEHVARLS